MMDHHKPLTRREICRKASAISAATRRSRRKIAHFVANYLRSTDPCLAQLNTADCTRLVELAAELNQIIERAGSAHVC
jgi:hypothetical protein